jgi:hypothetical protein
VSYLVKADGQLMELAQDLVHWRAVVLVLNRRVQMSLTSSDVLCAGACSHVEVDHGAEEGRCG